MEACSPEKITQYFDQLRRCWWSTTPWTVLDNFITLTKLVPFDHRAPNVVAIKGQKKVQYKTSGNNNQVTVIGYVSAAGQAIPPFVIFNSITKSRVD